MNNHKTAPGIVKMKCLIWEPEPLYSRPRQEESFTYNLSANEFIQNWPIQNIKLYENYISIRPRYINYDTFLFLCKSTKDRVLLQSAKTSLAYGPVLSDIYNKDYNAQTMFDYQSGTITETGSSSSFVPKKNWMWHQSFCFVSGLFDQDNIGTSFWSYKWMDSIYNPFDQQSEFDTTQTTDEGFTNTRKFKRLVPVQLSTTQTANATQTQNISAQGTNLVYTQKKPVHWLTRKITSLYEGEDFFVQFSRASDKPDEISAYAASQVAFRDEYAFLDSEGFITDTNGGVSVPVNMGVVQIDTDGTIVQKGETKLNLRKQPYYLLEINAGDDKENYWLVIPYNSEPVFIQASTDPVIYPVNQDGDLKNILYKPTRKISRVISRYSDILGGDLINQKDLKITIQNHFGKIRITFSGYENNPWIIEGFRYNYEKWQKSQNENESEIIAEPCWMRIKAMPISIGAGSIPCSFSFSPLHYEPAGYIDHPQSIMVKGPVEENEINLLLRSKEPLKYAKQNNNRNAKETNLIDQIPKRYNHDADLYVEYINGEYKSTKKQNTVLLTKIGNDYLPEYKRIRGGYGDINPRNSTLTGEIGSVSSIPTTAYPSIIKTFKRTALKTPSGDPLLDPEKDQNKFWPKHFGFSYGLRAGSVEVSPNSKYSWVIPFCMTPLATGWTLYVPPSNVKYKEDKQIAAICPTEVAQHVTQFTLNTSFTDNSKVEKSGSIRFIINFGPMENIDYANNNQTADSDICTEAKSNKADRSVFLSNLSGKTFTIRIYAWWEGGFMDCSDNKCPCKNGLQSKQGGDYKVVFTGLCHGGQITVENGKRYMDCQLLDYWKYLQDMQFLNSPYFDGMRNFNAVHEIMQIAGFNDGESGTKPENDKWPPGNFIRYLAQNPSNETFDVPSIGGEIFKVKSYGLPSAYDVLQEPKFKFADGSNLDAAIIRFAQLSGYMTYFDRYGIFRFVPRSDTRACQSTSENSSVKCRFYASPTSAKSGGGAFGTSKSLGTGCFNYDSLILNSYVYHKKVADVFNDIHLITTTPNGSLIIANYTNFRGKFDFTSEGYMGYTKRYLQFDGIFGSEEAVVNTAKYYSALFYPPITVQWEAFGHGGLNAGDLVTFTGLQIDNTAPNFREIYGINSSVNTVLLYLTSVSMNINPEKNDWKNKYEGEWIYI